MKVLIKLLVLFTIVIENRSQNDQMPKCRYEDKECLIDLCNAIFKLSANGIPQMNLVPTNPYEIRNVTVESGANGPINLKIQFKRANMTGIHLFHIDKIIGFDRDPRSKKEMYGSVKRAGISGQYRISGKFLLLPITGNGHADIIIENFKLRVQMKTDVQTRNGKEYLVLKKVIVRMEPEKLRVNFENLFNNKELSDNINAALSENSDLLYKELQVPIQNVVGDAMQKIFAPVQETVPYADFFLDD